MITIKVKVTALDGQIIITIVHWSPSRSRLLHWSARLSSLLFIDQDQGYYCIGRPDYHHYCSLITIKVKVTALVGQIIITIVHWSPSKSRLLHWSARLSSLLLLVRYFSFSTLATVCWLYITIAHCQGHRNTFIFTYCYSVCL